jgi:GntR family transcriptional regulator
VSTRRSPVRRPDRRRPEPLWHQVEQSLRREIDAGRWPSGSRIPGEAELTTLLGVSRITVRHALANLEAAGVLRREHGRGTFVRSPRLVAGTRALTSFSHEMAALGITVGSRLIGVDVAPAPADVAEALEISAGDDVVSVRRLRLGGGQPVGVQTAHLRADRVPGFLAGDLDAGGSAGGSLYAVLQQRFGIVASDASEVFRVAGASGDDAALLEIAPQTPVFVVERLTSDERGPFEFTRSTMRGDRYEIRTTLRAT